MGLSGNIEQDLLLGYLAPSGIALMRFRLHSSGQLCKTRVVGVGMRRVLKTAWRCIVPFTTYSTSSADLYMMHRTRRPSAAGNGAAAQPGSAAGEMSLRGVLQCDVLSENARDDDIALLAAEQLSSLAARLLSRAELSHFTHQVWLLLSAVVSLYHGSATSEPARPTVWQSHTLQLPCSNKSVESCHLQTQTVHGLCFLKPYCFSFHIAQEEALKPFVSVVRLADSPAVRQRAVQSVAAALTAHPRGLGSGTLMEHICVLDTSVHGLLRKLSLQQRSRWHLHLTYLQLCLNLFRSLMHTRHHCLLPLHGRARLAAVLDIRARCTLQ